MPEENRCEHATACQAATTLDKRSTVTTEVESPAVTGVERDEQEAKNSRGIQKEKKGRGNIVFFLSFRP